MIKKGQFFILAFSLLQASPVSERILRNVAQNFADSHNIGIEVKVKTDSIEKNRTDGGKNYRVITYAPHGWIIVASDDVARPVLAYNFESNKIGMIPSNFKYWMKEIDRQIEEAKRARRTNTPFSSEWKALSLPPAEYRLEYANRILHQTSDGNTTSIKGPFLRTEWGQGKYYNSKCPVDEDGPDGHALVGCLATAMAQIMEYYNWPKRGRGSHSYESKYGVLSADFGSTHYHWDRMPLPRAETYNDNLATLMSHVGIAINMDYSAESSYAYYSDADYAFRHYFRYETEGFAYRNDMNDTEWIALLKKEIDHARPLFYGGSGDYGGHAFVCDGYDFSDPDNKMFHFNWGWNGFCDGYYAIGALDTSGMSWNDYNLVLYGIRAKGGIRPPSDLQVMKIGKKRVVLQWRDNSKRERRFLIYWKNRVIKKVKANTTRTIITRLIPGTHYTLRVTAATNKLESRAIPVHFKTKGKRPSILPIYMNQTLDGKLTDRSVSVHRSESYARYYTFKLLKSQKVRIEMDANFYPYFYLLEGKGKIGEIIASVGDEKSDKRKVQLSLELVEGNYTIEATSHDPYFIGNFTISLGREK